MLSVGEFIASAAHADVRCIAGFDGIGRIVTSFSMIDSPEILQWVSGGELLVDCGYITANQPQMLVGLIDALKNRGCAALGIKLHRYWDRIPEILIEDGNRLHFPVLQLPYETRFSDLACTLHKSIFESELNDTQIASFAYMDIVTSFCKYKSARRLLYDLHVLLKRPLLLADPAFRLLGFECQDAEAAALHAFFCLDGRAPILPASRVREIRQKYEKSRFRSTHETFSGSGSTLRCLLIAVECAENRVYYLIVPEHTPLKNWEYPFLSNMEPLFLFCLDRLHASDRSERRSFSAIFSKKSGLREADITALCKSNGFDYEKMRVCVTLLLQNAAALSMVRASLLRDILIQLSDWVSAALRQNFYFCEYETCRIYYLLFPKETPADEILARAGELAERALALLTNSGFDCRIGISEPSAELSQIAASFHHTIDQIDLGRKLFPQARIFSAEKLQVYLWLKRTMRREELEALCERTVTALQAQSTASLDYVQILEVYMKNRYNVSKTAAELHFHRNTLMNYLLRIQQLLPLSMDDPENRIQIQLGLHALRLLRAD